MKFIYDTDNWRWFWWFFFLRVISYSCLFLAMSWGYEWADWTWKGLITFSVILAEFGARAEKILKKKK